MDWATSVDDDLIFIFSIIIVNYYDTITLLWLY